ncbi:MAG TPA: hypothetical protein VFZ66_13035 [Herpetosiphonaceae bacterium]
MTHHVHELLHAQAVSSAVQHATRDVIRAAANTVQRLAPRNDLISGMRESQLRNVVNVAIRATSVEEIAAFILYQMGRSTNSRQWLYGEFGDTVVKDLMTGAVRNAAEQARAQALATIAEAGLGGAAPDEARLLSDAYIALARQYLGYLNRLFYFADRTRRWDELGELIKEVRGA